MKYIAFLLMALMCGLVHAATAHVALANTVEDGKKNIQATVDVDGKPLVGAVVQFAVKRTFGNLILGRDTTLDDGTAAVAFPTDLPGDAEGALVVTATIQSPADYASVSGMAPLGGGVKAAAAANPFPRALWAPHAPLVLVATIFILVGGVWSSYLLVIHQILCIRKAGGP